MKNAIRVLLFLVVVLFCFIGVQAQNITRVGVCPSSYLLYCNDVKDNFAYVGGATLAMQVIDISDLSNPFIDNTLAPLPQGLSDINVYGNFVYATRYGGTDIIDISNPHDPSIVGNITSPHSFDGFINYPYLYGLILDHDNHFCHLQIYNISVPSNPELEGTLMVGSDNSYSFFVEDTLAYVVGFALKVINVANPANPTIIGSIGLTDPDDRLYGVFTGGGYAYAASIHNGLCVYDVSNPANPFFVTQRSVAGEAISIAADPNFVYVAGDSALSVFDITNPIEPGFVGSYGVRAGFNSITLSDSLIFVTDRVTGLNIFRLNPGRGALTGVVRDAQTHVPIEGAVVRASIGLRADTTDASGAFLIDDLYNTFHNFSCTHHDYFDTTYYDIEIVANDTALLVIDMQHYPPPDVGVSAVICPVEVLGGVDYQIKAEIFNNSSATGPFDVMLEVSIQDSSRIVLTDTYPITLMTGFSTDTIEFAAALPAITGERYAIKAYTAFTADTNPANDTVIVFRQAKPPCYLIFGNRDSSLMQAEIGATMEIPVWGVTPQGSPDSVVHMSIPLEYSNDIKGQMLEGIFPDTLVGRWDERYFDETTWWTPEDGYHWSQTMVATAFITDPRDPENFFWTNGDTVLIATFRMRVRNDTTLIGDTLAPFSLGNTEEYGSLHWDMQSGYVTVPVANYPRVLFLPASRCVYIPGDVNGNGVSNGIDVVRSVGYFKGGSPPPVDCGNPVGPCPQASPFYAAGDVNGDCVFNGIDITFWVNYLKGIVPALRYCPSCPPAE